MVAPMKIATVKSFSAMFLFLLVPAVACADIVIGGETLYSVREGDSLPLISARLGADIKDIARENHLNPEESLRPGQVLRINTRKIAPEATANGIVVDIPGRMLYYFKASKLEMAFPVGLGISSWRGITRWRTPIGPFTITGKERNPTWYVPESIQWQMRILGEPVLTEVPPGPDNPLGRYAIYTSFPAILIHETIEPTTVYRFASHGCIRVLSQNIGPFYDQVQAGTPGETVYEPVKAAVTDGGSVFLEVDPDAYGMVKDLAAEARKRVEEMNAANRVDWSKVAEDVRRQSGNAEDITLSGTPEDAPLPPVRR